MSVSTTGQIRATSQQGQVAQPDSIPHDPVSPNILSPPVSPGPSGAGPNLGIELTTTGEGRDIGGLRERTQAQFLSPETVSSQGSSPGMAKAVSVARTAHVAAPQALPADEASSTTGQISLAQSTGQPTGQGQLVHQGQLDSGAASVLASPTPLRPSGPGTRLGAEPVTTGGDSSPEGLSTDQTDYPDNAHHVGRTAGGGDGAFEQRQARGLADAGFPAHVAPPSQSQHRSGAFSEEIVTDLPVDQEQTGPQSDATQTRVLHGGDTQPLTSVSAPTTVELRSRTKSVDLQSRPSLPETLAGLSASAQTQDSPASPSAAPIFSSQRLEELRHSILDRVATEMAARVRMSQGTAQIQLSPPELGSLTIDIQVDASGQVQARIIAEVAEVGDLLHNHVADLKQALQNQNLDLSSIQVEVRDPSDQQSTPHDSTPEGDTPAQQQQQGDPTPAADDGRTDVAPQPDHVAPAPNGTAGSRSINVRV